MNATVAFPSTTHGNKEACMLNNIASFNYILATKIFSKIIT